MTDRGIGDNSEGAPVEGGKLRAFVERIEWLGVEKDKITGDMREVFAEAKGEGYDPKILRLLLRERKADADALAEQEALLDTYRKAVNS